jgi:hypothetical protein
MHIRRIVADIGVIRNWTSAPAQGILIPIVDDLTVYVSYKCSLFRFAIASGKALSSCA